MECKGIPIDPATVFMQIILPHFCLLNVGTAALRSATGSKKLLSNVEGIKFCAVSSTKSMHGSSL